MRRSSFRRLGIFIAVAAFNGALLAQTAPPPKKKHAKTSPAPAASQAEVQALRDVVQAQQRQIQSQNEQMQQMQNQLRQVLEAVQQSNTTAQKLQTGTQQAQATAVQAQQAATQAQQAAAQANSTAASAVSQTSLLQSQAKQEDTKLQAFQNLIGRFRFSGDVRIRGENFTQDGTQDRDRARIRVRFGVDGQLNEDFVGSFALATGSMGDPTSANETLTNAFDRKTIALDRGYITYSPVAHPWLSLTGGKFPYLWQRTSVTGDPDLNPEGFVQRVSFNNNGFVQNISAQAIELLYSENATGPDSYVLGAQAQATLKAGPWSATASVLNEHWNSPDALLQASAFEVGATTTGGTVTVGTNKPVTVSFPTPGEGQGCSTVGNLPKFAPCAFAPNGMTNATYLDASGKPHFYSGFDLADFILNNQIQTGASQFPINLLLEFEDNLDAAAHPLSALGSNPVLRNLGSQNKEYGADISLGRTVKRNNLLFGYAWLRQEQDAVLASIAESDQRAPTNILQNRVYANWKVRSNTLASFTWWYGRTLNTWLENNAALYNNWGGFTSNAAVAGKSTISAAGQREPWLTRLQLDLVYTY
ncbi:MAG TPA: putative porin [Terriglobales bacterium]|nr:putative porin [Terriglobales bacterium]